MFPQYTPNGISLDQLKKDAKKIKKDDNISYLEALDKVTRIKTNFKNWNDLQKFIKINPKRISKIKIANENIILNEIYNFIGINFSSGMGKTALLLDTLFKNYKNFNKIAFYSPEIDLLDMELPNNCIIINSIDDINESFDLILLDSLNLIMYKYLSQKNKEKNIENINYFYNELLKIKVSTIYTNQRPRFNSENFKYQGFDRTNNSIKLVNKTIMINNDEKNEYLINVMDVYKNEKFKKLENRFIKINYNVINNNNFF